MSDFLIRPVFPADHAAINDLLRDAYAQQMSQVYSVALRRKALPVLTDISPALLFGGRYVLAEYDDEVVGVAGWSDISPFGRTCPQGHAHVRHMACAPDCLRRGIGRALMMEVIQATQRGGVRHLHCLCPLNAAAFCEAVGFRSLAEVVLGFTPEISLPAVDMRLDMVGAVDQTPAMEAGARV
ncbi:GNAT family N-acetyltransferase [uncultured Roseovarius sp.]|uniref:GNAT family N-acetyltransferase n=1 Tax=uncultured Roseovarius sp. TaxID=293344 RepID=UPI00262E4432|nr:GNAT family N-acetyltransferase [uncultured Roseovarius sp.]